MFFIFWTPRTARALGQGWCVVDCEKCGRHFEYPFTAIGVGVGHGVSWSDVRGAEREAKREARSNLQWKLENAIVPMPCPGCGRYQDEMIQPLRDALNPFRLRPRLLPMFFEAIMALLGIMGLGAFISEGTKMGWSGAWFLVLVLPVAFWNGLRLTFLLIQCLKRWRFDPYTHTTTEYRLSVARRYTVPAKPMAQPLLSPIFDDEPDRPADQQ